MNEIITSMADLDDLDLDLDSDGITEVTDNTTIDAVNEIGDDDLVLDDLEPNETQAAATETQQTDDLKLDDSIDDLKLEDNITDPPIDKVNPELTKTKPNLDDEIELELDVNEGIKPTVKSEETIPEVKPEATTESTKKTRKPRTSKTKGTNTETLPSVDNGDVTIIGTGTGTSKMIPINASKYLDPSFPIDELDRVKYETRATVRSNETIEELAEKIKLQGQKEPIHVYIDENDKAYLLAGFHRVKALEKLGMTNAEAYIHKNISEAEIYKICTGTNEPRTQLTEWDKIVSVGKYVDSNPNVSIDDETDTNSVVSVFGYSRSSVYNYIKHWNFFKNNDVIVNHFNKNGASIPGYAYQILSKVMEECKEYNIDASGWVEILIETMSVSNRSTFAKEMVDIANKYVVKNNPLNKLVPELEKDLVPEDKRLVDMFINDAKTQQNPSEKNVENDLLSLENEINNETDTQKIVDSCYAHTLSSLSTTNFTLNALLNVEKYKELRKVDDVKKIKELICQIVEQVKKL